MIDLHMNENIVVLHRRVLRKNLLDRGGDKGAQASGILSQVRVIRCFSENTKIHKFDMAVPCQ